MANTHFPTVGDATVNKVTVFNGDKCSIVEHEALTDIANGEFDTKQSLVEAFAKIGVQLDPTKRISVEDNEMSQYHYFA